jgi:tripartite-type tricarboxylate transporter receptor subunit TctC
MIAILKKESRGRTLREEAMKLFCLLTSLAVMLSASVSVAAEPTWPTAPVRLIMPYPPATSGDLITRKIASFLTQKLGFSFYVENRPGANGNIGMKDAKDAAHDGYTFIAASDIQFAVSPSLYRNLPYDAEKDFTPVAPLARNTNVIVASRSLKADNLEELVQLAKAEPGKITYASTGVGSTHQLFMELLKIQGGFDMIHVPYKGTGEATPDLVSGRVDVMIYGAPQALAQVKAGKLKVLAVGSPKRLPEFPGVPTIAESGFPGFVSDNIWGVWAPAGTPNSIIAKFRDAIGEALANPDISEWYRASVLSPMSGGVQEMNLAISAEREKWPQVIKAANITLAE